MNDGGFEAWLDKQTWTIDAKNAAREAWSKAQDEIANKKVIKQSLKG